MQSLRVVAPVCAGWFKENSISKAVRMLGIFLFAFLMMVGGRAFAQNTGSIFGTVQDKSGAVVKGAEVTVVELERGVTRTVKTNGSGDFSVPSLPVGTYTMTVSAPTFETSVVTDIKIDADSSVKQSTVLIVGAATESVTVKSTGSTALDANSATLGTLIDNKMIEDLPIDGHNVVSLSALLPGVVDVVAPTTFTGDTKGPTYSASGSRNTQNLMLFDGLMWNNLFYNTGINYPPPNSLQEVSVLLNNYKAQYGRNAGSVFNVITKSGTNQFHGAAWDYLQNQMFNATDYISKKNPEDNFNQFGFTLGGPILKDKLNFFFAAQKIIGRLQTVATATTPGYAERGLSPDGVTPLPCITSIFAGLNCASFAADVQLLKLINPETLSGTGSNGVSQSDTEAMLNQAYHQAGGLQPVSPCVTELQNAAAFTAGQKQPTYEPNQEFPVNCLNPVMLNLFKKYVPVPNQFGNGTPTAVTSSPSPTGDLNMLGRLDFNIGRHTVDLRYNLIHATNTAPEGVSSTGLGIATYELATRDAKSNFGNIGDTWQLRAKLLNVARIGYKRFESSQFPSDTHTLKDFGGILAQTGLQVLPTISISGQFNLGSSGQGFKNTINENVEALEQMIWTKGNHTVQGGVDFLRLQYLNRSDYADNMAFSTSFTGNGLADALLGLEDGITAQNRLVQGGIQHDLFTYLQDDWRATRRLTLNLGVRYELPFQWYEPHYHAATFVPGIQSKVFPTAAGGLAFPGDQGVLNSLVPTDYNGIAPRLGFNYDAVGDGSFLIRGGYGIFFDAVNANVVGVGEPYHFLLNKKLPQGGASNPLLGLPVVPDGFDPKNPQFLQPFSIFFPDKNFRTPYVEAVNFGFQWKSPIKGVLDANYVGKFARKLTIPLDLNPAILDFNCNTGYGQADKRYCLPAQGGSASSSVASTQSRLRYSDFNFGGQGIVDILTVGTSSYNALQLLYTQRGGKYITILGSYTWSKSIDLQTNGQTTANTVADVFHIKSDRGPSDSNVSSNGTLGWVVNFPKLRKGYAIERAVLNNWKYSGTYLIHSGKPYNVTINNDTALVGEPGQRAALIPGVSPFLDPGRHRVDKVAEWFNRDAFTYPTVGTFSPVGRNSFIGPAYIMTNMTIGRDFPLAKIREGMRLNIRGEAYNVFNTPNLGNPNGGFSCNSTSTFGGPCPGANNGLGAYGSPNYGRVLNTFGNNANTSTNGRKMQFAAAIYY